MRIEVFGETWTLTFKTLVKVTCFIEIWNDPTDSPVILPRTVSHKTPIEVKLLLKVLKMFFSKVWGSVWGLYSPIYQTFCGNFDDNSIRTRLAWSRGSGDSKNHKYIYIRFLRFGVRRQRRQPVNNSGIDSRPTSIYMEGVPCIRPSWVWGGALRESIPELFTGCRLCRRTPKRRNLIYIYLWFFESPEPRDHANLVRIELSSKLPQKVW
jgi:hypothetical protein